MQRQPSRVLLLSDSDALIEHRDLLMRLLTEAGLHPISRTVSFGTERRADDMRVLLADACPGAIIVLLGDRDRLADPRWVYGLSSGPPVIVAGQGFDSERLCSLFACGVADFVVPPFTAVDVVPRVLRVIDRAPCTNGTEWQGIGSLQPSQLGLHGQSAAFLAELDKLPPMAVCDVTVLISGETGTGKELIARAIHYLSRRRDHPFVPIDCGAIPADLAESELFGHERGAYTGAATRTPGLIASAGQGTVFLDEVQALPLSVQAKLLRFLQEHEYRPLGSSDVRRADVRILSAANCDLREQVRRGEFREDLFYRLNVIHVRLPALRQRMDDILLLARHFIEKHASRFERRAPDLTTDAMQRLLAHDWPGNVRELEHVIEAAVVFCGGGVIDAPDLRLTDGSRAPIPLSFREAKARAVRDFERNYIIQLLRASGGNITAAARAAKKNRRAFWELLRKYRLDARDLGGEQRTEPGSTQVRVN